MTSQALLKILSDGRLYSDEQLSELLGLPVSDVLNQKEEIINLGLRLTEEAVGCSINGGLDLLSKKEICSAVNSNIFGLISDIDVLQETDSTNIQAMKEAQRENSGYVCTAELQTAGRGRRGRKWASPYGSNIYLSVVWVFKNGASSIEGLSLAVGVAVASALHNVGVEGVQLKWPNDIFHGQKKLGGILVEVSGNLSGLCHVVVGIGLNVAMPEAAATQIDQPWVDVNSILSKKITRNLLIAELLNELMSLLNGYSGQGFSAYKDRWKDLDAFAEKEVAIRFGDELILGIANGVDDSGAILVKTDVGIRSFNGGEVSLRGVN